jgi:hypothetical protein
MSTSVAAKLRCPTATRWAARRRARDDAWWEEGGVAEGKRQKERGWRWGDERGRGGREEWKEGGMERER